MKKTFLAAALTILVFLAAGCGIREIIRRNNTYRGENELWAAEYKLDAIQIFTEDKDGLHFECNARHELTVSYKYAASDLADIRHMEISYKTSAGGGTLKENYDGDSHMQKTYTLSGGGNGAAIEKEDETITVTITLDGEAQTLYLKNTS